MGLRNPVRRLLSLCCKCAGSKRRKLFAGVVALSIFSVLVTTVTTNFPGVRNLTAGSMRLILPAKRKMLIYVCVDEQGCAGWGDRQRALVSMFLLAQVTNRRFGILLQTPCDVRNFYVPNMYNWSVDWKDIEGRSQRLIYPSRDLPSWDINQKYPEDVLLARENGDCFRKIRSSPHYKPFIPNWAKKGYADYFQAGWNILMKPSPKVQRRLNHFLASVNFHNKTKPLVGVHMRMGKNPTNPHETSVFNNVSSLGPLWLRLDEYVKNGSQLFVASDSQEVRDISRKRFGKIHHDTAGVILHVGRQRHDARACQGFEDAVVDQLILSYCDILFISRGGFATRAAAMGGRVKRMIVFNKGKFSF
ncbi:uncharacterized protein LOC143294105 [Babylonia areolata]|uniref:uncharacterized protein LOC143294105 n=1 Tax=Babylonia areolata TaxID=304850 RepID=UPI003FD2535A